MTEIKLCYFLFLGLFWMLIYSFPSAWTEPLNNKTVSIGVIVDTSDERSAAINSSLEICMTISNNSKKVVKMKPIREKTDLRDSFKLRQSICNLVEQQPIALFGTSRSETFSVIESYSRALNIPYFLPTLTREVNVNRNGSYIINMCPSFIDAVIDFIKYLQWNRIFYLFDTDDGLWRLQKLYQAFSDRIVDGRKQNFLIDAIRIPDVGNCREILRKLDRNYDFTTKRIVVDLYSIEDYDKFMSQIIDVGMNRDGYHYVLGTLDITNMKSSLWRSFTFGGVNITGFGLTTERVRHEAFTEVLGESKQTVEVALTVDAAAVLAHALVEIMKRKDQDILGFRRGELYLHMNCSAEPIESLPNGHIIKDYILNVTLEGSALTGKVAFDEHGNRKGYKLDIHHLSYRSSLKKIGYWEDGVGLQRLDLKPEREHQEVKPLNRTRIVTTIINEPFIQEKKAENGKPRLGNDRYEGFCIDMMETVAAEANFSYRLKLVNDSMYGSKSDDGESWNGLIGELLTGDADIALASLSITHDREEAVYFTKPFMNTGISIMIKKPEREKPGVFSFMEPLSYQVWGCIIGGFLVVSFILFIIGRFSPYEWEEINGNLAPTDTFSFVNTLWFSLGALMQQGPDIFPRSLSGRVLASAWWFFTLITISSYTANLAAFLTFEKLTSPINSVDDLVKQTGIRYGTQKSGSTHDFFESSKVPIYEQMYNVMKDATPSVFVDSPEDGWERVKRERGKYAFMLESSSNNYYNQRKPCTTMKVGRNLDQKGYGIALPKYSDLCHPINIAVLLMRERGDLLKLEQKWWYSKGECAGVDGGDKGKNALNLSNVSGIFHILIGGLVVAMFISLSHIAFHAKVSTRGREEYRVNHHEKTITHPDVGYQRAANERSLFDNKNPVITCTTSNGGVRNRTEPHLIEFDDFHDDKIISLDDDVT